MTEAKAQLETTRKALEWGEAQAHQAESDVQAAELNLSYARVTAPADGYVTKKAVENGDYIQVGQKLMALVPSDLYVTANFKETQVEHIRPGQPVKITVDSAGAGCSRVTWRASWRAAGRGSACCRPRMRWAIT